MKRALRIKAQRMRQAGRSIREIASEFGVSKSTVSVWVRDIEISDSARVRLRALYTNGQLASQERHRAITAHKERLAHEEARTILAEIDSSTALDRLLCSLIYWCEGAKKYAGRGNLSFANSDPLLVALFLKLFRRSFVLDESKFRVCMHLHSYHDERDQLIFWSKTTTIPQGQFIRSYRKKESGDTVRIGYRGCVSVRYYDAGIFRRLLATAEEFLKKGP